MEDINVQRAHVRMRGFQRVKNQGYEVYKRGHFQIMFQGGYWYVYVYESEEKQNDNDALIQELNEWAPMTHS